MRWGELQVGEKLLGMLQIAYAGSCFAALPYVALEPIYGGLMPTLVVFLVPLGILELLAAYGIFSIRRWGRSLCKALAVYGILMTLFGFILGLVFSVVNGGIAYGLVRSGVGFSPIFLALYLPAVFPGLAVFYGYGVILGLDFTLVMAGLFINWSILSYLRKSRLTGLQSSPN